MVGRSRSCASVMLNVRQWLPILILIFGTVADRADADAIVVTKAMKASTIAEIFVQQNSVQIELEIGLADLSAFDDILSDEIYARLGNAPRSRPQRLERFFREKLVLRADGGQPLSGRVEKLVARRRLARDEVTGEPSPEQPKDAGLILHAVLQYTVDGRPASLTIQPPLLADSDLCAANIGFVCYHNGLPVNDFRYMPGKVTLDLDWTDPWYSRFRHPNLRRQFDAPLSVYLYVERYEVRQEIIVRPKDLQAWVDLGLEDNRAIPVGDQAELKERVAEFLSANNPVTIDGKVAKGRLDRIHFIHRTLRSTGIVEPPVELDVTSATLGVIFVYPTDKLPDDVSMTWALFSPKIQVVPAVASDEAGGLPSRVTPDDPVLRWQNYLTNPTNPQMTAIVRPRSAREFVIPILSIICGGVLVVALAVLATIGATKNTLSRRAVGASVAALLCGIVLLPFATIIVADPFAQPPELADDEARDLMGGLLHNVYRAFDHHDESLIYDRLSQSIAGDLLPEVYLETRQSMEVKNQGGLRISVKEVTVSELDSVGQTGESEFTYRCRWRVAGWIGHWGHVHRRVNEHLALVTLAPLAGRWKITNIEMLDEQAIELSPATATSLQIGSE